MPSSTFSYTGAVQDFVVPAGVTSLVIECLGAQGGMDSNGNGGGGGGRAIGTFVVTPGETLKVYVGGYPAGGGDGGFNGGADAGDNNAGGGGGASDVRRGGTALGDRIIVAGGAGGRGAGIGANSGTGALGGGSTGGTGGTGGGTLAGTGGTGGTQSAGGSPGTGGTGSAGFSGSLGDGGQGGSVGFNNPGGGGGGGYYGGGGGGGTTSSSQNGGGGGGGSNGPAAALSTNVQGYRAGHGEVTITWTVSVTRTGTVTAAPDLTATRTIRAARTGSVSAAPDLTATRVVRLTRTGNLASAPVLTAEAFVDDGTRSGTVTAAPVLSADGTAAMVRSGTVTAAPALTAVATGQVSPQRSGSVTAAPALSATAVISKQTRTGTITAAPGLSGPGYPDVITPPGPPVVGKIDLRLRAYAPNGADLGLLPAPDGFSAAIPLNDIPSLMGTYAIGAPRASLLGQPIELALEVTQDDGASWTEPDDCRFLYLTDGRDPVKTADAYAWEAKGYIWRLQKARVRAEGALNGEGRREFSATAGAILSTFWSEAQARGALAGMTLVGNGLVDAAGVPWGVSLLNRSYDLGQDYLTILLDLAAAGWVDFRMSGRTLKLYKPNTVMAQDYSVGVNQVALRPLQTTEAPFRRTWEGLANFIQVIGDEGTTVELTNPSGLAPWGRWEDFLAQAGVTDTVTLSILGTVYQQSTDGERVEYTQGLALGLGAAPLADFMPGDYVLTSVLDGTPDRFRVRQVTVQKDGNTVQGNVILNDRFAEHDIRVRRILDAIMSGASGSSSGGIPTPPGPDILQPAQVSTPTGSSSVFVDAGGVAWAQVSLDWLDVTTNLDGTPITDLDHYEVQAKKGSSVATTAWSEVTRGSESRATASPYVPGDVWTFRVRAVDTSNNWGPWSTSLTITMQADTTGPVKPSTPTATSRLGVGTIIWDGLPATGAAMDADFTHVDIHLSNTNGFTYSAATKVSDLPGAGKALAGPLTYNATYYGRLVPYDTSGNAGTPSDQFTFLVKPLVDVSNFPDDAMNDLYARTGHFLVIETDQINANSAAIGLLDTGYLIGAIIQGTEFWTNANPTNGGARLRDSDGFNFWANGGALTVSINRTTGILSAQGADFTDGMITAANYRTGSSGARLEIGPFLGDTQMIAFKKAAGTIGASIIGNAEGGIVSLLGNFWVYGDLEFPGGMDTLSTPPNVRIGDDGKLYKNPNMSYGANDSGGPGYKVLRVPN